MNERQSFRYCLNTSTMRECGLGVPREIEVVSQAGYQGIELWVSEIRAYLEDGGTLDDLNDLLKRSELKVPNLIAFFPWAHPDDSERQEGLDQARDVFNMARELGCPCVAAPPAGISEREDVSAAHLADCYRTLLEIGREAGVKPLLEFWGHAKVLRRLDEALEVLNLADAPGGAVLVDVFHMAKGGSRLELLRDLDADQLGLVHVNDYPGDRDPSQLTDRERVYPGSGVAAYDEILGILHDIGYHGFLSLELFNEAYQEPGADEVARTGLMKMKQIVESGDGV